MKLLKYFLILVILGIILGCATIFAAYKYVEPDLPDVGTLKDIQLQKPMLVYSVDGELMAQFGEKRRIPLQLEQIPPQMINAFIATEDSRFYHHYGVDPIGIIRALVVTLKSGGQEKQGASTITQQLARNYFLTPEQTIKRKVTEAFLALRIEQQFSKKEILELYVNKIFLGHRSYGVGAAAYVYFGKNIGELTLSEIAVIAGLPKAPSTYNPLNSLKSATERRNIVLSRLHSENYITDAAYQQALNEPIVAKYHEPEIVFAAPYLSEMVRQQMIKQFGDDVINGGYKVYTTVTSKLQIAATDSLRSNLISYDMRHGYRGPMKILWQPQATPWNKEQIVAELAKFKVIGTLYPAIVTKADAKEASAMLADGSEVTLSFDSVKWAKPTSKHSLGQKLAPKKVNDAVASGQVIRLWQTKENWKLAQEPEANAAIISLNPENGAIMALVGGFDFNQSKFNRVTQSIRQLGSTIKPFIYAAALDKGMTLATILNDLPITRWNQNSGANWRPKNSPARYDGPQRLRVGLGQSKNVMMVRAMRAIGVDYAADFLERFGFKARSIERGESLALGAATFTPFELVRGYSVFANGGYLVDPYFISKIKSDAGKVLFEAKPKLACDGCDLPLAFNRTEKSIILLGQNVEDVTNPSQGQPAVDTTSDAMDLETIPIPELEVVPDIIALPEIHRERSLQSQAEQSAQDSLYAPHVISTELAFLMKNVLKSNITGEPGGNWLPIGWRTARALKRNDVGGKTGTTNNMKDAWFAGFGPGAVTAVWVGFDDHRRSLGRGEAGANTAQPLWNDYMKVALDGVAAEKVTIPKGIIRLSIDMKTGNLSKGGKGSRSEYFIQGTQPTTNVIEEVGTTIVDDTGNVWELF